MNCKQGDLAVIVKVIPGIGAEQYIGKIIRCERLFSPLAWWLPDDFGCHLAVLDAHLRPIRDNDGEDEMVRIAGKPEQVTA